MRPTVAEFRTCPPMRMVRARTNDEGDRKYLLWRAKEWMKLAVEKEQVAAAQTAA